MKVVSVFLGCCFFFLSVFAQEHGHDHHHHCDDEHVIALKSVENPNKTKTFSRLEFEGHEKDRDGYNYTIGEKSSKIQICKALGMFSYHPFSLFANGKSTIADDKMLIDSEGHAILHKYDPEKEERSIKKITCQNSDQFPELIAKDKNKEDGAQGLVTVIDKPLAQIGDKDYALNDSSSLVGICLGFNLENYLEGSVAFSKRASMETGKVNEEGRLSSMDTVDKQITIERLTCY